MSQIEDQSWSVNWTIATAILVVLALYFGAQVLGGLLVSLVPTLFGWSTERISDWLDASLYAQFFFVLTVEALTVAGLLVFLKIKKFKLAWLGVVRPKLRDVGYVLAAYPLYFISFLVLTLVASQLVPGLDVNQEQQLGFDDPVGKLQLFATFISLVILPPLVEELLMRGYLFTTLRKYTKFIGATLVTSIIFAIAHLPGGGSGGPLYIAAIDTFILSLYLCWLREKTGSLWASVFLHAIKNGIAFMVLFVFPQR